MPHIPIWSDDVFDAFFQQRPNGVRKQYAWRGILRPGETLFLPGEMLHAVSSLVCSLFVSLLVPLVSAISLAYAHSFLLYRGCLLLFPADFFVVVVFSP